MLSSGPSFLPVDASLSPHGLPGSQLFLIYTGTWKGKQGNKTVEVWVKGSGEKWKFLHCSVCQIQTPQQVRTGLYSLSPEETITFFTVYSIYLKTGPYLIIFWDYCYKAVALRSVLGKARGTPDTSGDSSDEKTVVGRIPDS